MTLLQKLFGTSEEGDMDSADDSQELAEQSEEGGELALDVYQDKDNVIVKSTIAGVKPADLDITLTDNMVTIKGERKQEQEIQDNDYYAQECYWGRFYRSFSLPVEVDVDKAQADLKDGMLTIVLPKFSKSKTKKVKIKQIAEE